jgi:hypothetical protein
MIGSALLLLATAALALAQNLVVNPSFEQNGGNYANTFTGWSNTGSGSTSGWYANIANSNANQADSIPVLDGQFCTSPVARSIPPCSVSEARAYSRWLAHHHDR